MTVAMCFVFRLVQKDCGHWPDVFEHTSFQNSLGRAPFFLGGAIRMQIQPPILSGQLIGVHSVQYSILSGQPMGIQCPDALHAHSL